MDSINQLINLDLHPINKSDEYLKKCKKKLTNNSILQLDNFLSEKSLKNIQNEAKYLHSKAHYCSQNHTVLLNKKNNDLDTNDPCKIEVRSDKGCVPHDLIPPESDLSKLYYSNDYLFISNFTKYKSPGWIIPNNFNIPHTKNEVREDPAHAGSYICEGLSRVPIRSPLEMCEMANPRRERSSKR